MLQITFIHSIHIHTNLVCISKEVSGDGLDLLGPGGAPHQGLPVGADLGHDLAQLGLETYSCV